MENNRTPLHGAASCGDLNLVKEIYEKTPQLAQDTDSRGRLALHLAAARGYVEIVKLLVSNDDLDTCSARDADGRNPLHLAAMNGRVEVLNVLVERSPNAAEARANRGQTILHICFKYNYKEAIKLLLKNSTIQEELVNAKDDDGNTLLHLVVADQNATSINEEIVKSLLACPNIDASAINSQNETPLDIAVMREHRLKKLKIDKIVAMSLVNALREEDAQTAKELGRINWLAEKRGSLMVVGSLIAIMAFVAGLAPPGGLVQYDNNGAGTSVMGVRTPEVFSMFLLSNTAGFLGSCSVILLLISDLPFKNRFFMWVLTAIIWGTITGMAFTYFLAIVTLTPDEVINGKVYATVRLWILIWACVMAILLLIHTLRVCLGSRKVRNLKFYVSKSIKKQGFRNPNITSQRNAASAHPV